jgi:hypothetical protein
MLPSSLIWMCVRSSVSISKAAFRSFIVKPMHGLTLDRFYFLNNCTPQYVLLLSLVIYLHEQ